MRTICKCISPIPTEKNVTQNVLCNNVALLGTLNVRYARKRYYFFRYILYTDPDLLIEHFIQTI